MPTSHNIFAATNTPSITQRVLTLEVQVNSSRRTEFRLKIYKICYPETFPTPLQSCRSQHSNLTLDKRQGTTFITIFNLNKLVTNLKLLVKPILNKFVLSVHIIGCAQRRFINVHQHKFIE